MKYIFSIVGIGGLIFLGLVFFAIRMLGDKACDIEIQNGGDTNLILKTFRITQYDSTLTVDSVIIKPNDKLQIGQCINCYKIYSTDINFDAIGFYNNNKLTVFNRTQLIEYLSASELVDCATYVVR